MRLPGPGPELLHGRSRPWHGFSRRCWPGRARGTDAFLRRCLRKHRSPWDCWGCGEHRSAPERQRGKEQAQPVTSTGVLGLSVVVFLIRV